MLLKERKKKKRDKPLKKAERVHKIMDKNVEERYQSLTEHTYDSEFKKKKTVRLSLQIFQITHPSLSFSKLC